MNKRGNIWAGITFGLMVWIFGILILTFLLDDITQSRIDLQCASPELITSGTMIMCLMIDGFVPYFIWSVCSLFIGFIFGGLK